MDDPAWGDLAASLTTVLGIVVAAYLARRGDETTRRSDALVAVAAASRELSDAILRDRPAQALDALHGTLARTVGHPALLKDETLHTAMARVTSSVFLLRAPKDRAPAERQAAADDVDALLGLANVALRPQSFRSRERWRASTAFVAFAAALLTDAPPPLVGALLILLYGAIWLLRL